PATEGGPPQREEDNSTAVRRLDAAERRWLQGRHDSVDEQDGAAEDSPERAAPLSKPEPHEIAAADLAQSREDEQRERAEYEERAHDAITSEVRDGAAWYHPLCPSGLVRRPGCSSS